MAHVLEAPRSRAAETRRYAPLMRRIERLINLIAALLETSRPMTIHEIRRQIAGYDQDNYETFRRAFERDKEALRSMGIPLEVTNPDPLDEQADAYIIPKGRYYLPDIDFEQDELAALRLASQAVLGATDQAEAGLMKLSVEDAGGGWPGPQMVWGADVAAEQPLLGPVYGALLERRRIKFGYRPGGAPDAEVRTMDPYALVHRRGHWYVVGRDVDREAERSFKLLRIEAPIEATDHVFTVPEAFDPRARFPDEDWEIGADKPQPALVRFDNDLRWWVEQNLHDVTVTDAPEGGLDVELPVANVDALISWVIQFRGRAEIRSPEEARERLLRHLEPWTKEAPS